MALGAPSATPCPPQKKFAGAPRPPLPPPTIKLSPALDRWPPSPSCGGACMIFRPLMSTRETSDEGTTSPGRPSPSGDEQDHCRRSRRGPGRHVTQEPHGRLAFAGQGGGGPQVLPGPAPAGTVGRARAAQRRSKCNAPDALRSPPPPPSTRPTHVRAHGGSECAVARGQ